jgi:hypothetical protein
MALQDENGATTGPISCRSITPLGSWLLYYAAGAAIVTPFVVVLYPSVLRIEHLFLILALLAMFTALLYVMHRLHKKKIIVSDSTTIERIERMIERLRVEEVLRKGPDASLTEEEIFDHFPEQCRDYVEYLLKHRFR